MTVNELIEILRMLNRDKQICITFEGEIVSIGEENIYEHKNGMILIDADANSYRSDFEKAA